MALAMAHGDAAEVDLALEAYDDALSRAERVGGPIERARVMREYALCFPFMNIRKLRTDRLPMKPWREHVILVEVETVTKDYQQRDIPKSLQYSKLARIRGVDDDFSYSP